MSEKTNETPEEFRGRLAPGKDWTEIVAWVGDLPPLPHVAAQAIALVEDPDTTAGKLTELLGSDPALAARVLKIANSSMFSCQREITTLNQAIMIIGFKALKGIIVAATLRQLNRRYGKLEKMIWENSTCTATCAHMIAQRLRKHYVDEAFLLGLLHDLGKLVLARQIPDDYENVVKQTAKGKTFAEVETEELGFSHALIGALVAKKWNFSSETCQVILHHHDPLPASLQSDQDFKTAIIAAADTLAHFLGYGHPEGYPIQETDLQQTLAAVGISGEKDLAELVAKAKETFQQQQNVFG